MILIGLALAATATWSRLPSIPDEVGFAGPFAGVSHGNLLVAGGANFPERPPWQGGTKVWHDKVFALNDPTGEWQVVGKLPRPLGYGVSVSYRDRLICVGGSDANRHYADVFAIEWRDGKLKTTSLPSLPVTMANGCGALVGSTLYVAGGQENPDSTRALSRVFSLDLANASARWKEAPNLPGSGRILATAAAFDGAFWVFGGASLNPDEGGKAVRAYLRDAYRLDPARGWQRLPDLPHPVVAAPSPASTSSRGIVILGGDDGSRVGTDPTTHPGFSRTMLRYDPVSNSWAKLPDMPFAFVTTSAVPWRGGWVVPGGERRPGIRSNEVWSLRLSP